MHFGGPRVLALLLIAGEAFALSDSDAARLARGEAIARIVPVRDNTAAFVTGTVRIDASPEALIERLRRLETLRSDGRTLQMGPFGTPPGADDLAPLVFERQDLEDLKSCRVGACEMQVGDFTIALARQIQWSAGDHEARAGTVLKQGLLERVRAYLERGALPVYENNDRPEPVASAFEQILAASPDIVQWDPALFERLEQAPLSPLADVDDEVYWAKDKARSPVVSAVHMCIHRIPDGDRWRYVVCLRHIYDSRYFIGYAEFLSLRPDPEAARGFVLLRTIRALIDPPTGVLRGFLLNRIKKGMRDALAADLGYLKQRLEAGAT